MKVLEMESQLLHSKVQVSRSIWYLFDRKFQAAKFVAEHGGQVCPASWQPGEDTLKPGLDMVGKI